MTPPLRSVRWRPFERRTDGLGMCVADMDLPSFKPALDAARERLGDPILGYTYADPALPETIAAWQAARHGARVHPESITTFPFGAKTALHAALRALSEPDRPAAVVTPVYSGILKVLRGCSKQVVQVPMAERDDLDYEVDLDLLGDAVTRHGVATVVICSPNNPTGHVWSPTELRGLAELARVHDLLVIADEVHADLVHPGHRHLPWSEAARSGRWVTIHSIGKTFNLSGLPYCFVIVPRQDDRDRMLRTAGEMGFHPGSALGDLLAGRALTAGGEWVTRRATDVAAMTDALWSHLAGRRAGAGRAARPGAGGLVWMDHRAFTLDDPAEALCEATGIRALDGRRFGEAGAGFVRINAATTPETLHVAIRRIDAYLDQQDRRLERT